MRLFPWWFVFIAWFLVIVTCLTAGFFTILYGLQFGKRRQEQWLTALVISVFQDVLVSQPIKIFMFSLFIAFVIRKPSNVEVNEENDKLIQDEEWIQESLQKVYICKKPFCVRFKDSGVPTMINRPRNSALGLYGRASLTSTFKGKKKIIRVGGDLIWWCCFSSTS